MYSSSILPEAVSHRGLRVSAPENTLPAFAAALDAGAEGIELDVHASSDEVLYVHHDPNVPAAGGPQPIAALDSGAISRIRLAGDVAIPRLDDVLDMTGNRAHAYIEVKASGIEATLARCIRRHARNVQRCSVHSFDHRIARRMLELVPSLSTGILQGSYLVDSCAAMRAAGATDLWQHIDFVDQRLVADVRSCGGRLVAWTANEESTWERLAELGVAAICTDRVDSYVAWRAARSG